MSMIILCERLGNRVSLIKWLFPVFSIHSSNRKSCVAVIAITPNIKCVITLAAPRTRINSSARIVLQIPEG